MASEVANNAQEVVNATAAAAAEETKSAVAADAVVIKAAEEASKGDGAATDAAAVAGADGAAAAGAAGDGEAKSADAAAETPAVVAAPAKGCLTVKPTVHKPDFEKDIIYLYQFTRTPLLPSLSPYCLKAETWLRLSGLKYEVSFVVFSP